MTALYSDKYVPNILLEEYEKDNKVKKMNDITYRFMNFVFYSFIFY